MFFILISYRARGIQQFRREQLIKAINNFKCYFEKNQIDFKIIISEQNNDKKFNRGLLLNAAFLETEKNFPFEKKYIHMNTDYTFNLEWQFPQEMLNFKNGFIDLHRPPYPVLGAACVFDSESYNIINGFPNDLEGWGGDDWAIYNRIMHNNINLMTPPGLFNSGFIIEENFTFYNDESNNQRNIELARRDDFKFNGVNSLKYKLDGYGEFNDGNIIFHYLINE
jgi:N-terminal domain of galactosyltransferase/N-terminal region of glycosyl transferase group 7